MPDPVDVAIGILLAKQSGEYSVLIARRHDHRVLGGYWEFPGGKIQPDETVSQALVREFTEELGITVYVNQALPVTVYNYPHSPVRLHPFFCTLVSGQPQNFQVAQHKWVRPAELLNYRFPPANDRLIQQVVALLTDPNHRVFDEGQAAQA